MRSAIHVGVERVGGCEADGLVPVFLDAAYRESGVAMSPSSRRAALGLDPSTSLRAGSARVPVPTRALASSAHLRRSRGRAAVSSISGYGATRYFVTRRSNAMRCGQSWKFRTARCRRRPGGPTRLQVEIRGRVVIGHESGRGSGRLQRSVPCPGENPRLLRACRRSRAERPWQSSPIARSSSFPAVWCGNPAIRSMLMLARPAARRRPISSRAVARLCSRPYGLRFLIDKRLYPQAHPVHAALQQGFDESGSKRARSAFDRDLGIGRNHKVTAHGGKMRRNWGPRGSTEFLRRDRWSRRYRRTYIPSRRKLARDGDIFEQAGNVIFVCRPREDVGGEVTVAALGPAERDRDVEAEGHVLLYFILRDGASGGVALRWLKMK